MKELQRQLSVAIGIIAGVLGILAYIVKISMDYQRLKTRFEENEKRDSEERLSNAKKFEELYNSRNKTNETLTELTITLKMMNTNIDTQLKNLETKIDNLGHKQGN